MPERIEGGRLPILSWAADADEATLSQARNLADLEVARHHVALMPDAHVGFGMPIGGVLLTEDAVVPYAIGVDIGCGVQVARTNLVWGDGFGPEKLRNVLRQVQRDVPTGFSSHKAPPMSADRLLDLMSLDLPDRTAVPPAIFEGALRQVGTLGGGNHFLEVQRDPETSRVYFMLHSGSRSLGKKLCDLHAKNALAWCRATGRELPDKDLAWLPLDSAEGAAYWSAMSFALRWAEINRRAMMDAVEAAFRKHASVHEFERLADIHHNYAAPETHGGIRGVVTEAANRHCDSLTDAAQAEMKRVLLRLVTSPGESRRAGGNGAGRDRAAGTARAGSGHPRPFSFRRAFSAFPMTRPRRFSSSCRRSSCSRASAAISSCSFR